MPAEATLTEITQQRNGKVWRGISKDQPIRGGALKQNKGNHENHGQNRRRNQKEGRSVILKENKGGRIKEAERGKVKEGKRRRRV